MGGKEEAPRGAGGYRLGVTGHTEEMGWEISGQAEETIGKHCSKSKTINATI